MRNPQTQRHLDEDEGTAKRQTPCAAYTNLPNDGDLPAVLNMVADMQRHFYLAPPRFFAQAISVVVAASSNCF
jgi:hypothetical protein